MMYEANYGNLHVIVCESHLEERAKELEVKGEAAERINCYFCRGGQ